jgi:cysteine desulfurase / selenocysteine lyase
MQETVYLNNAGTSWPKPDVAVAAANSIFQTDPSQWPARFQADHRTVAKFFGVETPRLLLTPSCTSALSLALLDQGWSTGDRVLTSRFEHHALYRVLTQLGQYGVEVCELPIRGSELVDLAALRVELVRGRVRLVALTAACNVTGQQLPIAAVAELAHRYGARMLVDGAQTAGWLDIDLREAEVDLFTFAGHKAPQGPWGVGGLYVSPDMEMSCPLATCEIQSESARQFSSMPGYCDAGSVNLSALAGLAAALDWLQEPAQHDRLTRARYLTEELTATVRGLPGLTIHGDVPFHTKLPTLAITVRRMDSSRVAEHLRSCGIIASGGFQCAPRAHESLGTSQTGIVRLSFGPNNQEGDVEQVSQELKAIVN